MQRDFLQGVASVDEVVHSEGGRGKRKVTEMGASGVWVPNAAVWLRNLGTHSVWGLSHLLMGCRAELLIDVQHQGSGVYPRMGQLLLEPFERAKSLRSPSNKMMAFVPIKPSPWGM